MASTHAHISGRNAPRQSCIFMAAMATWMFGVVLAGHQHTAAQQVAGDQTPGSGIHLFDVSQHTDEFMQWVVDDSGSAARTHVSLFKPKYGVWFGHTAVPVKTRTMLPGTPATLVVVDPDASPRPVAPPIGWQRVFHLRDCGSSGRDVALGVWCPVARRGYVALGCVWRRNRCSKAVFTANHADRHPPTGHEIAGLVTLREDLATKSEAPTLVYKTKGSDARERVSLWTAPGGLGHMWAVIGFNTPASINTANTRILKPAPIYSNPHPACAAVTAAAQSLAPILKFDSSEKAFPSSIDFFLPHVYINWRVPGKSDTLARAQPAMLTSRNLQDFLLPKYPNLKFAHEYMSLLEAIKKPTQFLDWMAGQDPKTNPPVYTVAVRKAYGIYDLVYMFFYPYNIGKYSPTLKSFFGNHVGDWEMYTARTIFIRGKPIFLSGATSRHGSLTIYPSYLDMQQVRGGRSVLYVAAGGHGLYRFPGISPHDDARLRTILGRHFSKEYHRGDGSVWDTHHNTPLYFAAPTVCANVGQWGWWRYHGRWGRPPKGIDIDGQHPLQAGPTSPNVKYPQYWLVVDELTDFPPGF